MGISIGLIFMVSILIGAILSCGGFSIKRIMTLVLGGGSLLLVLQILYFYIGEGFDINLFFIKGNFEVNNFVSQVEDSVRSSLNISIYGAGYFALFCSFLIPACLEEYGKYFIFTRINKKLELIKSVNSAMFGIFYVALGFALFETSVYIIRLDSALPFLTLLRLIIIRGILSTLSHILFSVIIGYYLGKALFLKFQIIDNLEISKTTKLIKKFRKIPLLNINTVSKFYYVKFMFYGFSISILLHSLYNFFMKIDNVFLAALIVFSGIGLFYNIVSTRKYSKNYLELKKKIEYLKEMKALKEKVNNSKKDIFNNSVKGK